MSGSCSGGEEMPAEIDFSAGARGKFYRQDANLRLPICLDPDVRTNLTAIALARGATLSDTANDLLKMAIANLKAGK
jgi:hypothetical protein